MVICKIPQLFVKNHGEAICKKPWLFVKTMVICKKPWLFVKIPWLFVKYHGYL